jgi:tRNA pseudouridine32 synthase/23S rRNA pseudouridine746 synthase
MTDDIIPTILDYRPPTEPWLSVVYEDADLVILDKPTGRLSVPGRHPSRSDSLQTRALARWPSAGMVHRLDKDTSGVMVLALNKRAHGRLGSQFEHRKVEKSYVARVWGVLESGSGVVDLPLATDWERKPRQRVDFERGRRAQTEWTVIARDGAATRVRLVPLTGRTHQLRVHMLAMGHPILGDPFYAEGEALAAAERLQLHAETLAFTHPTTGERVAFTLPAPF